MGAAPDITGTVLDGRYRLVRLMGEGGMGQVYEGLHDTLDRKVAVKILLPRFAYDARFRERFLREAKAASKVRHPNVVQIIDFGDTPTGSVYFAMEYLEGRDLRHLLHETGAMPWSRARGLLLQITSALAAAHERGVIHRDLKPANFFISDARGFQDFVKVLDFGIAKIAADGAGENSVAKSLTGTGQVFGTAKYMAPEQAYGSSDDPRVDVYSVGVVAYELLTGKIPFDGGSAFEIITRHVNEPPTPPRRLQPSIPSPVEAVILRALAKKADERYPSMEELQRALLAIPVDVRTRGRLAPGLSPALKRRVGTPGDRPTPAGAPAATPFAPTRARPASGPEQQARVSIDRAPRPGAAAPGGRRSAESSVPVASPAGRAPSAPHPASSGSSSPIPAAARSSAHGDVPSPASPSSARRSGPLPTPAPGSAPSAAPAGPGSAPPVPQSETVIAPAPQAPAPSGDRPVASQPPAHSVGPAASSVPSALASRPTSGASASASAAGASDSWSHPAAPTPGPSPSSSSHPAAPIPGPSTSFPSHPAAPIPGPSTSSQSHPATPVPPDSTTGATMVASSYDSGLVPYQGPADTSPSERHAPPPASSGPHPAAAPVDATMVATTSSSSATAPIQDIGDPRAATGPIDSYPGSPASSTAAETDQQIVFPRPGPSRWMLVTVGLVGMVLAFGAVVMAFSEDEPSQTAAAPTSASASPTSPSSADPPPSEPSSAPEVTSPEPLDDSTPSSTDAGDAEGQTPSTADDPPTPTPGSTSKPKPSKPKAKPRAPPTDAQLQSRLGRKMKRKCKALGSGQTVTVEMLVSGSGKVLSKKVPGVTGELAKCLKDQASKATFNDGGTRTISLTVSL